MRMAGAALLVLGLILLRLVGLGQYPLVHPDEGFWAGGPRNLVLFGDGLLDGRLHPFLSPATFVLLSGWFSLLSPSLITARLFSVFTGLLACGLVGIYARRAFPCRPWLLLFLFGFSSMTVLTHRVVLLEAQQMLWLVLAAVLWLSPRRGTASAAGAAFGLALLVKSNSLYLLPAFLLTLPRHEANGDRPSRRSWAAGASFLLACGVIGGGGYLSAWAIDPDRFIAAFRYELDGEHFLDDGVLFHVGRFGAHPASAWLAFRHLLLSDPLLLVLALGGFVQVARCARQASRADRFFVAWVLLGLVFHFGQIYVQYRYLTTLAPALAYLAARAIDARLAEGQPGGRTRPMRVLAVGVLLLFCGFHVTRVASRVVQRPNDAYWHLIAWVTDKVPRETNVLAAPSIGLSLPQRSYDFYRLLYPYDGPPRNVRPVVERYDIGLLLIDSEWKAYETPDMARFVAEQGAPRASLAGVDVVEIARPGRPEGGHHRRGGP